MEEVPLEVRGFRDVHCWGEGWDAP
jgi:hypothetical protein